MLWLLSGYIPVGIIAVCFLAWATACSKRRVRPVKDKLLRSAGESLRAEIETLDENIFLAVFCLIAIAAFLGWLTQNLHQKPSAITSNLVRMVWGVGLAAQLGCAWRLLYLIKKRRAYGLGFSGERAVGEELNKLMRDGCIVFHDLPGENWNIDHVVIARTGVYVIETKTRRKPRSDDPDFYKVRFDGNALHFPGWKETKPLKQAERNTGWLCDLLSKALREPIQVKAIVTIPGWYVSREGKGAVTVLSHKEIKDCVLKGPDQLTSKQMEQIAFQIEQKCRDVSF